MKILNYGSLNIDYVYQLDHFVKKGETISSEFMQEFCGGKGLNQSVALAKAGAEVYHAGKVGKDGQVLLNELSKAGVNTELIADDKGPSGHAIIQVDGEGDNSIILFGGANRRITPSEINHVMSQFVEGDLLLLQNEINNIDTIIRKANEIGLKIVMNPAPMDEEILRLPLELIDVLILNEVEGQQISGSPEPEMIMNDLISRFPEMVVVLTLGCEGVMYRSIDEAYTLRPSGIIDVVDTTAAGDTFIGFFLTCMTKGLDVLTSLTYARNASEICITKLGASESIPCFAEVEDGTWK